MKKTIILNSILIAIGFAVYSFLLNLLQPNWLGGVTFLALPILAGALTVLVQNKNRSYQYLPKVLAGSIFYTFLVIFLIKLHIYILENLNLSLWTHFNPFSDKDQLFIHGALAGIYLLGGLIGIVIRGANIVFLPKHKFNLNNLSKQTYAIIAAACLLVFGGGAIFASMLSKNIWVCENGQWVKDGAPNYDKPKVACINGTPYFWNDGPSGLEIAYPENWRNKIDITHHEEDNKRVVKFDYKNLNGENKMLFSASIFPADFGLDKIFSLSNERPILKTDEHIIAVSVGELPQEAGGYAILRENVDEVIESMRISGGRGERIASGADIWRKYQDDKYGFSMDYPSNLRLKISDDFVIKYSDNYGGGEKTISKVINFAVPYTGQGLMNVGIYENPEAKTLDEWLKKENERLSHRYKDIESRFLRYVIDEKIKVDGVDAIVVYQESDMEKYDYNKEVIFFKNDLLFTIYYRGIGNEKLWKSFKFL
ncbi:hypothetical protein KAI65_05775 [Candidatus Parcubacteria bacterium]|nr:hypothetical protein [Candidatus Parcubacteria bacterium]